MKRTNLLVLALLLGTAGAYADEVAVDREVAQAGVARESISDLPDDPSPARTANVPVAEVVAPRAKRPVVAAALGFSIPSFFRGKDAAPARAPRSEGGFRVER